jgi:hypothetical protein
VLEAAASGEFIDALDPAQRAVAIEADGVEFSLMGHSVAATV